VKIRIKLFDILIILFVAGLIFFTVYAAYMKPHGKNQILIRGQGREWTFPAGAEETVVVPGPVGNTIVRLHENRAWIESSPCDNQNCVVTGVLVRQGQWAACLPNNVLLMVQGVQEGVDAIVW